MTINLNIKMLRAIPTKIIIVVNNDYYKFNRTFYNRDKMICSRKNKIH